METAQQPVIPKTLFYYATEDVLNGLWHEELKVTSPSDFNDPFEFLPAIAIGCVHSDMETAQEFCLNLQKASDGRFYALCLSRKQNDVRMWAQYGGNYTGVMLTLDFTQPPLKDFYDQGGVRNIDYDQATRHEIDQDHLQREKRLSLDDIKALLSKKGLDWKQGEETRVFLASGMFEGPNNSGKYGRFNMWRSRTAAFLKLPHQCIAKVTMGLNAPISLHTTVDKIRDVKGAKWIISKAKLNPNAFSLVEEVISPAPA